MRGDSWATNLTCWKLVAPGRLLREAIRATSTSVMSLHHLMHPMRRSSPQSLYLLPNRLLLRLRVLCLCQWLRLLLNRLCVSRLPLDMWYLRCNEFRHPRMWRQKGNNIHHLKRLLLLHRQSRRYPMSLHLCVADIVSRGGDLF